MKREEIKDLVEPDWLEDPFIKISGPYHYDETARQQLADTFRGWAGYHFSVRLNLDGADYFCRQVLGTSSRPDDLGLFLLAHRMHKWYLQAFFNALFSALDVLFQEINVFYKIDLPNEQVDHRIFSTQRDKMPATLVSFYWENRSESWYSEIRYCRNVSTHRHYLPTTSMSGGTGENPLDYDQHSTEILCGIDDQGKPIYKNVQACGEYLTATVKFISSAWRIMYGSFSPHPPAKPSGAP